MPISNQIYRPSFFIARSEEEFAEVKRIRQRTYVDRDGRLATTESSFDRFNSAAEYLVWGRKDSAKGTIKIILDSEIGLPCEKFVAIENLRSVGKVTEFGHFITDESVRSTPLVLKMMQEAVTHCYLHHNCRFIIGDMFLAENRAGNFDKHLYSQLGATPLYGPYNDHRFLNSPLSLIWVVDVDDMIRQLPHLEGVRRRLLIAILRDILFAKAPDVRKSL